ncbi:MAG: biotin transporter BioY [Blautia sp.]|nr:biotin transporter BioY [Blautia sp.]
MQITGHRRWSARDLSVCGLFAALIAVGAFLKITIPVQPAPMTFSLQWFFVLMAGLLLEWRLAAMSVGVYLLAGLSGVPVFAHGGGLSYVLRPGFGYLLGFLSAAFFMGWLTEHKRAAGFRQLLLVSFAGLAVYYGLGLVYYYFINVYWLKILEFGWALALTNGLLLTVGEDFVLCVLAAAVSVQLRPVISKIQP